LRPRFPSKHLNIMATLPDYAGAEMGKREFPF
jgi:hypothetical protein